MNRRAVSGRAKSLILAACTLAIAGCGGASGTVVAVVGGEPITARAYEDAYLRTRTVPPENDAQKREFLDRLIDYRVKLQEARALGLASDPDIIADSALYRDQLAMQWVIDEGVVVPGTHKLFDRRCEQIYVQQVEIHYRQYPDGSQDTISTRQLAQSVLAQAEKGTDFDSLVLRYSDDTQKRASLGRLGWFVAGESEADFDDLIYSAKGGEVIHALLRTQYGYHVLRNTNRIPTRMKVLAGHILFRLNLQNPTDTAAGYARLALILDTLRRGKATFEDLARRNSQDSVSGAKGGELGWMERGMNIEPTLQAALFNLREGEVSGIVRTPYGLHILKVLKDPPPPLYEDEKSTLNTIYMRERFALDYASWTQKLREKNGYAVSPDVAKMLVAKLGPAVSTSTPNWEGRLLPQDLEAYLFRFKDKVFRVRDVREVTRKDPTMQMRPFTLAGIDSLCILIANREVMLREAAGLEQRSPAFRRLLTDYTESSLVSRLENDAVRSKVSITDDQARAWWEKHHAELTLPDRVNISEIFVFAKPIAQRLLDSLKAGTDFGELARRHTKRPGMWDRNGLFGWVPLNANDLSRATIGHNLGDVVGPVMIESGFSLVRLNAVEAAREKTYDEARNEVLGRATEEETERQLRTWTEGLRAKHGVTVFEKELVNAFPSATR